MIWSTVSSWSETLVPDIFLMVYFALTQRSSILQWRNLSPEADMVLGKTPLVNGWLLVLEEETLGLWILSKAPPNSEPLSPAYNIALLLTTAVVYKTHSWVPPSWILRFWFSGLRGGLGVRIFIKSLSDFETLSLSLTLSLSHTHPHTHTPTPPHPHTHPPTHTHNPIHLSWGMNGCWWKQPGIYIT